MKKALLFVLALIAVGCADTEQAETPAAGSERVTSLSACESVTDRPFWTDEDLSEDVTSRFEAWLLCAEDGDHIAQWGIARAYATGEGIPEDDVEAARWYRLAAEQGYADAQYSLGLMYLSGEGVPEDDVEAVRWWRLAAEQGLADAQFLLGVRYAEGEGVPQDNVLAYMWYNLAAAQGNEDGQDYKDEIEPLMTREQIAEAQRLSREWLEAHPGGN